MDERDRSQSALPSFTDATSSAPSFAPVSASARPADGDDATTPGEAVGFANAIPRDRRQGFADAGHTPSAPPLPRLHDDGRFRALLQQASSSRAYLADRAWDNLAHLEHFARAAAAAGPLLHDYRAPTDRRAVAHGLFPLLPVGSRKRAFEPLDDAVAARAPDFRIHAGDVPRIAPVYSAFLARPDLVDHVVQAGAGPFLVPKSVCPATSRGTVTAIVVDEVISALSGDVVRAHVPLAWFPARGHDGAPGSTAESADDARLDVRTGPDGKPLLTVDGKAQPILVAKDVVTAWMFGAGPDARGLDLREPNDRALLLAWAHALRNVEVRGRSAFAWLEDGGAPLDVRVDVVGAAVTAACSVIARHTLDPIGCRISLRRDGGDGDWQRRAGATLDEVGLFRDVHARDGAGVGERDIVWADAALDTGFASGRLSAVAAGRAFARLATSALASLGVLPLSGLKDGSGAVVLQRLVPLTHADASSSAPSSPSPRAVRLDPPILVSFGGDDVPRSRALVDAWTSGEGSALPEPRGAARHDVAAMPAWFAFFQEQLAHSEPRERSS